MRKRWDEEGRDHLGWDTEDRRERYTHDAGQGVSLLDAGATLCLVSKVWTQ
jgi:hypothetical protein